MTEALQEQTDKEVADAFAAGFTDTPQQTEAKPEPVATEQQESAEPSTQAVEEPQPEEKAETQPETVTITAEQWKSVQDKLAEIDSFKERSTRLVDQSFGKIGELNRTLQQLQPMVNKAGGVKLSAASLKRLGTEFPEMAQMLAEDLSEALGAAPQEEKPVEQKPEVEAAPAVPTVEIKHLLSIDKAHPDWRDTIRSEDFNKWGNSLPAGMFESIVTSNDYETVITALDAFKVYQQKQLAAKPRGTEVPAESPVPPKKQNVTKRLEAAITPRGTASTPSSLTDGDLFRQGFLTG